jgi:hypothetical protein
LPRHRALSRIALVCAVALAATVGGCSGTSKVFDTSEGGWFSKPIDVFAKPDWAKPAAQASVDLGPTGPVGPEDLVNADGSCAPPPAPAETAQAAPQPAPAADRPVGSLAGDLAGAPMPAAPAAKPGAGLQGGAAPGTPPVVGGIALGMTECQAVRRAGTPSNISISAGAKGERKAVLTYLSGPWPGVYTFSSGRLKVIERVPEQAKPNKKKPNKKKKRSRKRAKSAANHAREHVYVQ